MLIQHVNKKLNIKIKLHKFPIKVIHIFFFNSKEKKFKTKELTEKYLNITC